MKENSGFSENLLDRVNLRNSNLTVDIVSNGEGLVGREQIKARESLPQNAEGRSPFYTIEEHFSGYNGIVYLSYQGSDSPFLRCAAGLNAEFYFNGIEHTYEPRWTDVENYIPSPSSVELISSTKCKLTIEPGPRWKIRQITTFELNEPYYVDFETTLICEADIPDTPLGYLGAFWASYIDRPSNSAFYFIGRTSPEEPLRWIPSTQAGRSAVFESEIPEDRPDIQAKNTSALTSLVPSGFKFFRPFYYGMHQNMLLLIMFERKKNIRFTFNLEGGGISCPAWDYQLVWFPEQSSSVSFRGRLVYKPFVSRKDVIDEYVKWADDNVLRSLQIQD